MKIFLLGYGKIILVLACFFKKNYNEVKFFDDKFSLFYKDNESFFCYFSKDFNFNNF